MYLKDHSRRIIVGGSHDLNILIIKKSVQCNKKLYPTYFVAMFVFACSKTVLVICHTGQFALICPYLLLC